MKPSIPLLALFLAAAILSAKEEPSPGLSVIHKDVLGGEGSWDYLPIDSAARRIYIARETRVLVVDMNTRKVLKEIEGTSGVHGFAVVADLNKGFSSNGRSNTVTIFDLKTFEKIGEAKTGPKPDAIIYEPVSKRVFAFNNGGTTATAIDAATGAVAGTVELGGAPEFAVSDMKGMMFVNLEDNSEVVQFDPDPHQAELLTTSSREVLMLCGRQTGKSTAAAVRVVYEALHFPKETILLAGPTGRQSGHIMVNSRRILSWRSGPSTAMH